MTATTGRRIGTVIQQLAALVLVLVAAAPAQAQTETVEYYALDAIGSVRVVLDTNGNVVGRMDYDPYGVPLSSGAGLPSRAYAGLFRDDEAGLDHAQARSYQARTGRLTDVDPMYAGLFEPQRWNRYAYALNNPLSFVDPTGLVADENEGTRNPALCTSAIRAANANDFHCGSSGGGGGGGSLWGTWSLGWGAPSQGGSSEGWLESLVNDLLDLIPGTTIVGTPATFEEAEATEPAPTGVLATAVVIGTAIVTKKLPSRAVNRIASTGVPRKFIATPGGTVVPVPGAWASRIADNGRGILFQRPGALGNADAIRIMDEGYMRIYNGLGQPLDVFGKPGTRASSHISLDYQGPISWPW